MKRTDILNMTASEAADELTLMEVKKLLQRARKAHTKADELTELAFQAIEDMCIDLTCETGIDDHDSLEGAIYHYINDENPDLKELMKEIRTRYCKDEQETN